MKQTTGSTWEFGGCVRTGGMYHPLPWDLVSSAPQFQNGFTLVKFPAVTAIQS
jgi:hypothetical protein